MGDVWTFLGLRRVIVFLECMVYFGHFVSQEGPRLGSVFEISDMSWNLLDIL